MSGDQGIQTGDHNTQTNIWLQDRKNDADKVDRLAADEAADWVAELEPRDAAYVLATASAGASAGVLRVLLMRDPNFTMAILAKMNRDKAKELVASIGSRAAGLARLPEAAEAIADLEYAIAGEPELGQRSGPLALAAESERGTQGFYRNYANGEIHWCARAGAQPTRGAISRYYIRLGGTRGRLGFPLTPDLPAGRSPFGTDGSCQRFESAWSYPPPICERLGIECGATVYWCPQYGAHATWGGIGEWYEQHDGTLGPLGFPVDEEVEAGPSRRESGPGTVGWLQRFEGGVVYFSEKTGAVFVPPALAAHHDHHGGAVGDLGFPVSQELLAPESPFGTTGRLQRFEARSDYAGYISARWPDYAGPAGATVYASEANGVHCVGWGNGHVYEKMGGPASWLGYPQSDEVDARSSESQPWCTIQKFEGGAIFYKDGPGSIPVPRATMELIARHDGLGQGLGVPVRAEVMLDGGPAPRDPTSGPDLTADREQFFEHGVVTVRNGVMEVWLRAPT
jgi:uncharacterized protein with LGFP repeats